MIPHKVGISGNITCLEEEKVAFGCSQDILKQTSGDVLGRWAAAPPPLDSIN